MPDRSPNTPAETDAQPDQLSKAYRPEEHEPRIWDRWTDAGAFRADPARVLRGEAEPYCILIPPPNVTAALHLGHALNNTIQDVLVRAHRMMGYETLWMPGTDHAGIATQTVVDKRLREAGEPGLADYKKMQAAGEPGREKFTEKIQAWKDEYEHRITSQLEQMGCSCDWDRQRFTMDEVCARAVREAFFQLFKDGLIYRGKRLVNWDPVTQTALADDEVEQKEVEGAFYYLRYPLVHLSEPGDHRPVTWSELEAKGYPGADTHPEDDQAWVTVATTRPETYLGDTAVAMNPKDPRAEALRGLHIELPLVGRIIPLIEDDYVVLPVALGGPEGDPKAEYATGFLKVTPAHDPNDWEIGQRHAETIKRECSAGEAVINVMAPDASISADHGWIDYDPHSAAHVFIGKSREDARELVVREFQAHTMGDSQPLLAEIKKPYVHSVGHSYRSHAPIEPYLSDQWYCKVTDDRLRGTAQRALKAEQRTDASLEAWPESKPQGINEPRPSGSGQSGHPKPYLITFTTYGTWLHGDERGSADRDHNEFQTPYLEENIARERSEMQSLKHEPVDLDHAERELTAEAIKEVCEHRGWTLHAGNVRSNHVHVVVSADASPERVMNDFKSYATRKLREDPRSQRAATVRERTWTRHGSTRYLEPGNSFARAVQYVLKEQGENLGGVIDGASLPGPLPHGRGSLSQERSNTSGDGAMTFHPARYAKNYETWHDNLRDWCISRQLWWGHRIPVWTLEWDLNDTHLPSETHDSIRDGSAEVDLLEEFFDCGIIEHLGDLGIDADDVAVYQSGPTRFSLCVRTVEASAVIENLVDFWSANRSDIDGTPSDDWLDQDAVIPAAPNGTVSQRALTHWQKGLIEFTQDPDVLDTWFSSALWPLSTLGWPRADLPMVAAEQVDPKNAADVRTVYVKRVGTWSAFIGTEGEHSGELIDRLLHLRDHAKTAEGHAPLAYQFFSEAALASDGRNAQPLVTPDQISGADDLICAVAVRADAPIETTKFGPLDVKSFLLSHGFQNTPGLLNAFNPTSVLCTAREIITLWVSRMAMFNRYFLSGSERAATVRERTAGTGEETAPSRSRLVDPSDAPIPFHDVFIHAMIQDGEGRKMSKSLGNGVDPLDIIHSHGADAMRFTLVEMTTQTQDVRMPVEEDPETGRNTSPKFDLGRNFCNKLWNAARFALTRLPEGNGYAGSVNLDELTLADRWMLIRLHAGVEEIEQALKTYQFSAYAKALYDLVRRDFCDWYLEAIKPTVAESPEQRAVLRAVLDALLRVLHPVVPFITEAVYERVRALPVADINGLTLGEPRKGGTLCTAGWPMVSEELADGEAERAFERVRSLVDTVRGVRSQHQVAPKRRITLHVSAGLANEIASAGGLVETLAGVETVTTDEPSGASVTFAFDGAEHRASDLADALDPAAERARLEKEMAALDSSIENMTKRLANPGYAERAPAHLVQQTRDQLAAAEADRDATRAALERLP